MREEMPDCCPTGVYCVKRTCAALDVSRVTLAKYRLRGYIRPLNANVSRYKYSGQSIIDCWKLVSRL